jgi:hypothetical protein
MLNWITGLLSNTDRRAGAERVGVASHPNQLIVCTRRPLFHERKTTASAFRRADASPLLPTRNTLWPGGLALPLPWDPIRVYF